MNANTQFKDRAFIIALIFILASGVFFSLAFSKTDSFLWLNQHHADFSDSFFTYFTLLGDGWFSIIAGIILFFLVQRKLGYKIIVAYIASGLLAQLFKRILHLPRPKAFFAENTYQYFIDGVTHSGLNSFPSGHTTSAFALAMVLCLYTKNLWLRIIYILIAFAVGYSRIYLGQHFLEDVVCGAALGLTSGFVVYKLVPLPILKKSQNELSVS